MTAKTPSDVSVIVPTFNRGSLVCEAIESINNQTRPVAEIIVVDDGSTDDTFERLVRFGDRIRYVRQENSGPSAARNRGILEAKGTLVAFLDSDDLWPPDKNEVQLQFLEKNPDIDFVFGDMSNFTPACSNEEREIKNPVIHRHLVEHSLHLDDLFETLVEENVVPTPTVMARKAALVRVGKFDESLRIAEDLDFWLRASASSKWGFLDAVLLRRRRHEGNLIADWSRRNLALIKVLDGTARKIAQNRPGAIQLVERKLREINYDLGSAFLRRGDFVNGSKHLQEGRPSGPRAAIWIFKLVSSMLLAAAAPAKK
jgi:glycosyltransferase involved in cell wall biosynthesis